MNTFRRQLIAVVLSSSVFFSAPALASVTVGTASIGGNCFPFGCGYTGTYQQVYGASAFSAPTTINNVEFFASPSFPLGSNGSTYTLNFYLTSKSVDGLSTNPADNRTTLLSSFGTFVPGASYSFTGNSFSYNPLLGNLLLDISTSGSPGDTNALSFSSLSGDAMSNLYRSGGTGALTTGTNGLVTRFAQVSVVPEPGTWAMMLLGFAGVGMSTRRRRGALGLPQIA